MFLNKKNLEVYCIDFKYFKTNKGERIITSNFIVKKDKNEGATTKAKPKINKKIFIEHVDEYVRDFFNKLFAFASENKMLLHWGSAGFLLNVDLSGNHVNILYGYCSLSAVGLYISGVEIRRKINNAENLIDQYFEKLQSTNLFKPASNEIKWVINKPINNQQVENILDSILFVKNRIEAEGLIK